jgi:hypothetical protein
MHIENSAMNYHKLLVYLYPALFTKDLRQHLTMHKIGTLYKLGIGEKNQ